MNARLYIFHVDKNGGKQLSSNRLIVFGKYRFTCYIAPEEVKVLLLRVIFIEKSRAICLTRC
jgi:hypothetical protein